MRNHVRLACVTEEHSDRLESRIGCLRGHPLRFCIPPLADVGLDDHTYRTMSLLAERQQRHAWLVRLAGGGDEEHRLLSNVEQALSHLGDHRMLPSAAEWFASKGPAKVRKISLYEAVEMFLEEYEKQCEKATFAKPKHVLNTFVESHVARFMATSVEKDDFLNCSREVLRWNLPHPSSSRTILWQFRTKPKLRHSR